MYEIKVEKKVEAKNTFGIVLKQISLLQMYCTNIHWTMNMNMILWAITITPWVNICYKMCIESDPRI